MKPVSSLGPISWVQRQMSMGVKPQDVLREYVGDDLEIPSEWDELKLWKIIISMMVEPKPRDKLPHINTLQDVIDLLKNCRNIMVLTGAGVRSSLLCKQNRGLVEGERRFFLRYPAVEVFCFVFKYNFIILPFFSSPDLTFIHTYQIASLKQPKERKIFDSPFIRANSCL